MNFLGTLFTVLVSSLVLSLPAHAAHHTKKRAHAPHHPRAVAHPIYGTQNLTAEIQRLISQAEPHANVGIHIKSMKQGDTLYTHNAQQLFVPASILKIMTAEAALIYLGPDYKFSTRVLTDAQTTSGGWLNGNMYLVHSGDPSLTYYDLNDLMVTLKAQQIQGIQGNVFIDNSAYDQDNWGPGWSAKDTRFCYAAPINASIINHNCLSFAIAPAKTVGRGATIIENPRFYYSGINNSVITKNSHTRACHVALDADSNNNISISGCMPKGHYLRGASVVISNIMKYNESLLHNLLKRFGLQVTGHVSTKTAPDTLTTLAVHQSKPLHVLINEMLKKSDNIIAESLLKKMGQTYANQPGSWSNGGTAVKQVLAQKAAVNTGSMHIIDGSGLSRNNTITPTQMMQVLDYAFHNYSTNYELISALPIAGVDGTLKHRLKNVAWKVRAKTGTLAGVVSLAGYAISKDREPLAFVIIVNGQHGNVWKYREMEDKIVTALTNYTRG